jgi:hypothetical protein
MPRSSGAVIDLETTHKNIRIAGIEMQRAWDALKAAHDNVFDLRLRLSAFSTAGSER